jgi:hypothetical protein
VLHTWWCMHICRIWCTSSERIGSCWSSVVLTQCPPSCFDELPDTSIHVILWYPGGTSNRLGARMRIMSRRWRRTTIFTCTQCSGRCLVVQLAIQLVAQLSSRWLRTQIDTRCLGSHGLRWLRALSDVRSRSSRTQCRNRRLLPHLLSRTARAEATRLNKRSPRITTCCLIRRKSRALDVKSHASIVECWVHGGKVGRATPPCC